MPDSQAQVATEEAPPREAPDERREAARSKPKRQPPYAVVLHNDDHNGFEHVVCVLRKVFNYDKTKAYQLMLQAHLRGQSIVWSGTLEVAELKADQIRSCGADPDRREAGALPLTVTLEPLPQ
jgi:ATP-dependent Clp protease adaptor protein ClpS